MTSCANGINGECTGRCDPLEPSNEDLILASDALRFYCSQVGEAQQLRLFVVADWLEEMSKVEKI